MSRCDGLNVGMLLMSLIKPVEIRVTVAPVSISKFVVMLVESLDTLPGFVPEEM
jgi:hypothetical protein